MTLVYPAWCSALDRAIIEQAVEAHAAPFASVGPPGLVVFQKCYPSETAAVHAILAVSEVVVSTLTASRACPSPEACDAGIQDLIEQLIVWAGLDRPQPATPLNDFATTVRQELTAWWPAPETTVAAPAMSTPDRLPPGLPVLLTLPEARKRFKLSIDTMERMEKDGELEIHRIGKGRSRRVAVTELQRVLALAKNWKYQFPDRDR